MERYDGCLEHSNSSMEHSDASSKRCDGELERSVEASYLSGLSSYRYDGDFERSNGSPYLQGNSTEWYNILSDLYEEWSERSGEAFYRSEQLSER